MLNLSRTSRIPAALAVCASFVIVVAIAWTGCATGGPSATHSTKDGGTSKVDGGTGGGDASGDDSDVVDTALFCGEAATNDCPTAIDIGALAVGDTKSITGSLAPDTSTLWYKVTFSNLDNTTAHPHVTLTSTDTGFSMALLKSCVSDQLSCGDEDALAGEVKEFEMSYRADPDGGDGSALDADPTGDAGSFIPITLGVGGEIYIHISRPSSATGCDFSLKISN